MKAMTVRQPYASQIVHGTKTVENRNRPTYFRGPLLIHAGGELHQWWKGNAGVQSLPLSAIVGEVEVAGSHSAHSCDREDCVAGGGMWPGQLDKESGATVPDGPLHHWVLTKPFWYDQPIPATGQLGFWVPTFQTRDRVARARRTKHAGDDR